MSRRAPRARRRTTASADRDSRHARSREASVGRLRRARTGRSRPRASRRWRIASWWPSARARRRIRRAFRRAPRLAQLAVCLALGAAAALAVNGVYQILRKPTELFFPVSGTLWKTPDQTWRDYAPLFRRYSTHWLTPEFLAALAQVEGAGNPIARTYWRWSWKPHFFELYRPASSAVGMYQITDGTFAQARRYCIHDHVVLGGETGAGGDGQAGGESPCWLPGLYFRVIPSHAVELTAAYLERQIERTLARTGRRAVTGRQAERLAAIIHLCGAGAGEAYARRGFRLRAGERCGDQDPRAYVARVEAMQEVFARLAARD